MGVWVPTLPAVKNMHVTLHLTPPYLQFHICGFNQPEMVRHHSIYCDKYPLVIRSSQLIPVLFKGQLYSEDYRKMYLAEK